MDAQFDASQDRTLRDYLTVLKRWRWLVAAIALGACAAGFVYSNLQTRRYQATTQLVYEQSINLSNPLSGSAYSSGLSQVAQVQSAVTMVGSSEIQQRVEAIVGVQELSRADYELSAQAVAPADKNGYSNALDITAVSTDPELAAAIANAAQEAVIGMRVADSKAQIKQAETIIEGKLKSFSDPAMKLSTDYIILQQRLRDLQILEATVSGDFRLVARASVPDKPFAPRPIRSAILGLALGLFLGFGAAFLLEQLDTGVHGSEQLASIMRQPILGRIPRLDQQALSQSALVALSDPGGHAAESFRMLRTNLEFMAVDGDVKSILVSSSLQGEGKSVMVCNLAISLALGGKRVVLVDGDLRRPRIHAYFGLQNEVGLSTVVAGKTALVDALQAVSLKPRDGKGNLGSAVVGGNGTGAACLQILPSGPIPPNPGEICVSKRIDELLERLTSAADVVLVDSPAMLAVGDTAALGSKVDAMLYLVDPQKVKRPMLVEANERLAHVSCKKLGLIVMRGRDDLGGVGYYYADSDGESTKARVYRRALAKK